MSQRASNKIALLEHAKGTEARSTSLTRLSTREKRDAHNIQVQVPKNMGQPLSQNLKTLKDNAATTEQQQVMLLHISSAAIEKLHTKTFADFDQQRIVSGWGKGAPKSSAIHLRWYRDAGQCKATSICKQQTKSVQSLPQQSHSIFPSSP